MLHCDHDVGLPVQFSPEAIEDNDSKPTAAENSVASSGAREAVAEVVEDAGLQQEVRDLLGLVVVLGQDNGEGQEDWVVVEFAKNLKHCEEDADLVGLCEVEMGLRELLNCPRVAWPRLFVGVASVHDGVIEVPELLLDDELPNGGRSDGHDEDFVGVLTLQKLLQDVVLVLGEGIRVVGGQGKSHDDNYELNGKE